MRMLKPGKTYDEVYNSFSWNIPQRYNIANDVCDQWAEDPGRVALVYEDENKEVLTFTFADIRKYANQFANILIERGLKRGDRVTLLLAQDPECAIAHV
ncbi:MAG: acetyl-CoA synthetase, partial [Gammaproteobacteria bacterium]